MCMNSFLTNLLILKAQILHYQWQTLIFSEHSTSSKAVVPNLRVQRLSLNNIGGHGTWAGHHKISEILEKLNSKTFSPIGKVVQIA